MPAPEVQIGGEGALFVGEDKTFELALLDTAGDAVDMLGWAINFCVGKSDKAADVFDKVASITGVFNIDPLLNTQLAVVSLTDTELNTVKAKTYRYSWKRMDDGTETVLVYGDFVVQKATAP